MSFAFNLFSKAVLDSLQEKMPSGIASGMQDLQSDFEHNLRSAIEANLKKLNLVTREEFDIQQQVLLRTREKLELLEAKIAELEITKQLTENPQRQSSEFSPARE